MTFFCTCKKWNIKKRTTHLRCAISSNLLALSSLISHCANPRYPSVTVTGKQLWKEMALVTAVLWSLGRRHGQQQQWWQLLPTVAATSTSTATVTGNVNCSSPSAQQLLWLCTDLLVKDKDGNGDGGWQTMTRIGWWMGQLFSDISFCYHFSSVSILIWYIGFQFQLLDIINLVLSNNFTHQTIIEVFQSIWLLIGILPHYF